MKQRDVMALGLGLVLVACCLAGRVDAGATALIGGVVATGTAPEEGAEVAAAEITDTTGMDITGVRFDGVLQTEGDDYDVVITLTSLGITADIPGDTSVKITASSPSPGLGRVSLVFGQTP